MASVGLGFLMLGQGPVDAGQGGILALAFAGGDDQVFADLLNAFPGGLAAQHGVQHVVGDHDGAAAVLALACGGVQAFKGGFADGFALYVEGMVMAEGVPFAFDHAWCIIAASDRVIESTLPDGMGLAYLGIALTDHYRRAQQSRRGLDAVITGGGINLADNADALRGGLPDDA
jgi:hypothetical protein